MSSTSQGGQSIRLAIFFHEVPQSQPIVETVLFQPLEQVPSVMYNPRLGFFHALFFFKILFGG